MKRTVVVALALLALLLASSCSTSDNPLPGKSYYYAVNNVDLDGQVGDASIAKRARVSNDPLGPGATTHTFTAGTLRFETFVCYDGLEGDKTIDSKGARFGLRITNLDPSVNNPVFVFTQNTVKNAGTNDVQTPLSGFTAGQQVYLSQFNLLAEPSTGIVWGSAHFESLPSNITWELKVNGNTKRWDTSANFSSGSVIAAENVCSSFALPIEWVSKPALINVGGCKTLTWAVNEIDVDYYEIRRSETGLDELENWELVDVVPSQTAPGIKGIGVVYIWTENK